MEEQRIRLGIVGSEPLAENIFQAAARSQSIEVTARHVPLWGKGAPRSNPHASFTYRSLDDMLWPERVDAIALCAPLAVRESIALRAIRRGIHVISATPLAVDEERFDFVASFAHQNDVQLRVLTRWRMDSSFRACLGIVEERRRAGIKGFQIFLPPTGEETLDVLVDALDAGRLLAGSELRLGTAPPSLDPRMHQTLGLHFSGSDADRLVRARYHAPSLWRKPMLRISEMAGGAIEIFPSPHGAWTKSSRDAKSLQFGGGLDIVTTLQRQLELFASKLLATGEAAVTKDGVYSLARSVQSALYASPDLIA